MKTGRLQDGLQAAFRWGALLTLCTAPTQWTVVANPRLGLADLLLAATAGVWGLDILLTRGWHRLWAVRPHWTHLLFTLCAAAAVCTAVDRGEAIKELVQIFEYFIVGAMVFAAFLRERDDTVLVGARLVSHPPLFPTLGVVTAVVLALALVQYFSPAGHRSIACFAEPKTLDIIVNVLGGRESPLLVGGTFGNRNVLGGFLTLALPLAAAGALGATRGIAARCGCALLVLAGLTVNLSGASCWAVVIAVVALAAARGAKVFIPVALVLVLWQACVLRNLPRENDLCHFESVALYDSAGQPTRRYPEWQAAASMILTHPWLGVGPGNYQRQVGPFYGQVPNATGPAEPDIQNLYLVLGATCGLPALLAFGALLTTAIGSAQKAGRTGVAAALAAFALACVWHPLLVRGLGLPLVFVLALARHPQQEKAPDGPVHL
mgnify:FL=1